MFIQFINLKLYNNYTLKKRTLFNIVIYSFGWIALNEIVLENFVMFAAMFLIKHRMNDWIINLLNYWSFDWLQTNCPMPIEWLQMITNDYKCYNGYCISDLLFSCIYFYYRMHLSVWCDNSERSLGQL